MIMKYIFTIITTFAFITPVLASTVEGTIETGVSSGNGVEGIVVEQPTATPPAGEYTSAQSVVLSGGEGTLFIRYTTDGSAVSCTTGNIYNTPIEVSSSLFIEAISCYPNSITSGTPSFAYTINPPSPPAPSGGGGGGGGGIVTTPQTADYDFNSDGNIDVFDFNILIVNWGSTSATDKSTGDANGDGNVDIFDFNLLIINWQS